MSTLKITVILQNDESLVLPETSKRLTELGFQPTKDEQFPICNEDITLINDRFQIFANSNFKICVHQRTIIYDTNSLELLCHFKNS